MDKPNKNKVGSVFIDKNNINNYSVTKIRESMKLNNNSQLSELTSLDKSTILRILIRNKK